MRIVAALAAAALLGAAGCTGSGSSADDRPLVVAAFYPLAWMGEQVAGGDARVVDLTPPGAEPHDLELSPGQVRQLEQADVVVYLSGGFQPAVEDVVKGDGGALDLRGTGADPHVWLDPSHLAEAAGAVAARLGRADTRPGRDYPGRAADLAARLRALDREFREGLADCDRREIVTSHEAFGRLAARYRLEQVAVAGLEPEADPSPKRLREVAEFAKRRGATTIFVERAVPDAVARTIAKEAGAKVQVLDPLEFRPESGDYVSVMRANLAALRTALGCR